MGRSKTASPKRISEDPTSIEPADELEKLLAGAVSSIRSQAQSLNYPEYVEEMLVDVLTLHLKHLHKQKVARANPVNTLLGAQILAMNILRETIIMCVDPATTKAALKAALQFIEDTAYFSNAKGPAIKQ